MCTSCGCSEGAQARLTDTVSGKTEGLDDPKQAHPHDHLFDELAERMARGPVTFALTLELAEPGDCLTDPTQVWPAGRTQVVIGHLTLLAPTSIEEIGDPAEYLMALQRQRAD